MNKKNGKYNKQSDVVIPNSAHQCHPELVSGSQELRRFRNKFGMTINKSTNDKKENKMKTLIDLSTYQPIDHNGLFASHHSLFTRKCAFTLAEVLITLGIIGIVAAITIPNLISNYKAKILRTQFLKTYSTLAQTIKLMENDDVSTDLMNYPTGTRHTTLAKYMTNTTICSGYITESSKTPDGCYDYKIRDYDDGYKFLTSNGIVADGIYNDGQLMLPTGALIFFDDCPKGEGYKGCRIYVDINGLKQPNRMGYDFFAFEVLDGTLYPVGGPKTDYLNKNDCNFDESGQKGFTCAQKAMSDSDYFKRVVHKIK